MEFGLQNLSAWSRTGPKKSFLGWGPWVINYRLSHKQEDRPTPCRVMAPSNRQTPDKVRTIALFKNWKYSKKSGGNGEKSEKGGISLYFQLGMLQVTSCTCEYWILPLISLSPLACNIWGRRCTAVYSEVAIIGFLGRGFDSHPKSCHYLTVKL